MFGDSLRRTFGTALLTAALLVLCDRLQKKEYTWHGRQYDLTKRHRQLHSPREVSLRCGQCEGERLRAFSRGCCYCLSLALLPSPHPRSSVLPIPCTPTADPSAFGPSTRAPSCHSRYDLLGFSPRLLRLFLRYHDNCRPPRVNMCPPAFVVVLDESSRVSESAE